MNIALQVRDLRVGYGRIEVVHGVSLEARAGRVTCLLGTNGAGKTTTIRGVLGLQTPRSGTVIVHGVEVGRRAPHRLARLGVALVPEGRRVFARLSVRDNLRMGAVSRRRTVPGPAPQLPLDTAPGSASQVPLETAPGSASQVTLGAWAGELDRVLDLFPELRPKLADPAGLLSGGQQQMLAIGRALMARPRLLILDEPSMGLSPKLVARIYDALAGLRAAGHTILLAEQNARLALDLADHAYVLETGVVVESGTAAGLVASGRVRDIYLGG